MFRVAKAMVGAGVILGGIGWLGAGALAQDVKRYKPPTAVRQAPPRLAGPNMPEGSSDKTPLIHSLRGVAIVGRPDRIRKRGINADGVVLRDDDVVFPAAARVAIEAYLGKNLSLHSLNQMTRDVVLSYRQADLPVVNVVAPEQDITNGVLQLIIVVGRLGEAQVAGNRYFPKSVYLDNFTTPPGTVIDGGAILDDLRWMNRNPFRRVDAIYAPGHSFGETDVTLRPYELRPFTMFAGVNNDGNDIIGRERLYAGAMVGNLLGLDEVLGYQFTTDASFKNLHAHVLTAQVPLSRRSELQLIGSYVTSDADINQDFATSGRSSQLAGYYVTQIPRYAGISHDARIGLEFKSTNNNLEFGGTSVSNTTAEINQIMLGYAGEKFWTMGHTRFDASVFYSPGDITGMNTDVAFQAQRAGAQADYAYAKFGLHHRINLPKDWRIFMSVNAQISSANLLASESFTLGGPGTVRGFETNVARGDSGVVGSVTFYTPGISIVGKTQVPDYFANSRRRYDDSDAPVVDTASDQLRLLAFIDAGWANSKHSIAGEQDRSLAGAGIGLLYEFGRYFSAEVSYGWQLREKGFTDDDDGFLHFRGTARY